MEKVSKQIESYADILRLTYLRKHVESTLHQAQIDKPTYQEYTLMLCYVIRAGGEATS